MPYRYFRRVLMEDAASPGVWQLMCHWIDPCSKNNKLRDGTGKTATMASTA
jgi:hypothetical protein